MKCMITAHSGCENTEWGSLESIEKAIALNADAIEIDVRRAPDGVLRLTHNALSEEEYSAKVRIEEAFALIKDTNLLVNCDLKEPSTLYYVIDKSKEYGLNKDRLILTGCTSAEQLVRDPHLNDFAQIFVNLEQILKYDYFQEHKFNSVAEFLENLDEPVGRVKYEFNMDEYADRVISYCKLLGVAGLNLPYQVLTEPFANKLNEVGILFSAWTVNDKDLAYHLLEMNPANITTRSVNDLLITRAEFYERRLWNGR